jgi:hypothetical protein
MDALNGHNQDELTAHIRRFGRRLRWRDGWRMAQQTLWLPFLAAGLVNLTGRLLPIRELWLWMAAPSAVWLLGLLLFALFRPLPLLVIARRIDLELGLRERLGTAYLMGRSSMQNQGEALSTNTFQPALVDLQQQDALSKARAIDPQRALPLSWQPRPLALAAILVVTLAVLAYLPNPMDEVLTHREAVAQAAEEQAKEIERLGEEIAESQELSPEIQEELLRRLAELAEQLRANPGDLEQALADLSRVEEALRAQLDPQAGSRQAALEALAAQLQAMAQTETGQSSQMTEAAAALERLAEMMEQMDPGEQADLAQTLAQMAARASQAGDTSLAQALAAMAQAAQSGDAQAASQAASQSARAFSQAQGQFSDQASIQEALARLQGSRESVARAGQGRSVARAPGQGQGQGEGNGDGDGDGDSDGDGEGSGQGQGAGPGQGQPGGGGGSNANTLPPAQAAARQVAHRVRARRAG